MEAEAVHIRDIVAKPGTRASGFLTIGETPTEPIRVPLVVVHGHRPGPRLCLTAGVHAAEYPGIDAVMQTVQRLNPTQLAARANDTILHAIFAPAFTERLAAEPFYPSYIVGVHASQALAACYLVGVFGKTVDGRLTGGNLHNLRVDVIRVGANEASLFCQS